MAKLGFMQGRLCAQVDGKIQAFPWEQWPSEFPAAEALGLGLVEWTLDQDRLYENPLMTAAGQAEIRRLCAAHRMAVPSLTGDCFMQAPFWKAAGAERERLQRDFLAIAEACSRVGVSMMVVPLVDKGRLDDQAQEEALVAFLTGRKEHLARIGVKVIFESDFVPAEVARFIGRLDARTFGINYDIGNSASLGFKPDAEFAAYGPRIVNVHVKDRVLGGTTVPLGTGNADFESVFANLARLRYDGNFILQTARAAQGDHAVVLARYRDMTLGWLARHAA